MLKRVLARVLTCSILVCGAAERELFNFGWKFTLGDVADAATPTCDDSKWRRIDLPHDFQMEMPWCEQAGGSRGFKEMGTGWYRKHFTYDSAWAGRAVYLDFGGIMFNGDVYVNGRQVYTSNAGYTGFEVDITAALVRGTNVVAVRADTGPRTGARWYTGGGIYRDVYLFTKDPAARISRHGVYVTTPSVTTAKATARVQVELDGLQEAQKALDVCIALYSPEGKRIAQAKVPTPCGVHQARIHVTQDLTIPHPVLWSCTRPVRYRVEARLMRGKAELDKAVVPFGIRTIAFSPDFGFRLNGEKVFLKGVANHDDHGPLGIASFERAIRRRLMQLKAFGFNAIRCSHNPYSETFLNLADELGFLVVDEVVDKWSTIWAGRTPYMQQWPEICTEWVRRDRNHPCVILWSLGNETQADRQIGFRTDDFGVTAYKIFDALTKRWDNTRPTTVALYPARAGFVRWREAAYKDLTEPPELAPVTDVTSFNYTYDQFPRYHQKYPQMIFFQSEAATRGLTRPYFGMDHTRDVGLCYWGAIEYWGESDGWPKKGWNYSFFRHSLDILPTAYLMKSAFEPEKPLVHVTVKAADKQIIWNDVHVGQCGFMDNWNLTSGATPEIQAFSNAERVDLFLNGRKVSSATNALNHFYLGRVPWQAGCLEAVAYTGGKEVARDRLETTGNAVHLNLSPEAPTTWQADGMDLQFVRIRAVDKQGRRVRATRLPVTCQVTGAATLYAVDDGDNCTAAAYLNTPHITLYDGEGWAILRSRRAPGAVTLRVTSATLGTHEITLQTKGATPQDRVQPLPEHPRPDWQRTAFLNLNGAWEFGFAPHAYDRTIQVPFGWGSPASGVKDEGDTGYYRRSFVVPQEWKGKRVFVVVGAADHDTTCRFDGETLGSYSGGYVPFEFELTDAITWGRAQTLELDIWDPPPKTAHAGHYLYGKQGYGNVRGIWQTVYLEARGTAYLEHARFTPMLAQKHVTFSADLAQPAPTQGCVTVTCAQQSFTFPVARGAQKVTGTIPLAQPHYWSLEDPYLYPVTLTYGADAVQTYFGFREIGVGQTPNGDPALTLNGKPLYLQLCLDQSYDPKGWYTFPSDEVMKNEILISKRLALSGNRIHIKAEVPRKLYWADKLGLLIQADVPCAWGEASEKNFEEHWKCFEAMVRRDYNHPSIYQWTLFNETWGLFSNRSLEMGLASGSNGKKRIYRASTQRAVAAAYRKAKALDASRLIEDNSPCHGDHVITDVNTWHAYCPGYAWEQRVADACAQTYVGSAANYTAGHCQNGAPMMNSECGNVWGYAGSAGDVDFSWDYHLMMNAFRRHLKCTGWLYTEHHDVINEWNGYVRFDRTPKFDGLDELAGMTLASFHQNAAIYFAGTLGWETGETLPPGATITLPIGVSLTTDLYAGKTLTLELDGRVLPESFPAKSWQCETLWRPSITLPNAPACGIKLFILKAEGKEIARNFWSYSTVLPTATMAQPTTNAWSLGVADVLGGLKLNGFGAGYFEYILPAPTNGGIFRAELSAKRLNGKDRAVLKNTGLDCMLGGGTYDHSANANSYPQTSTAKHAAHLTVFVNGQKAAEEVLPDDPADHRGILSWLAQKHDRHLHEAGSYGYRIEVPIPASAVHKGTVTIRLASDQGLAVYGPRFGRYPFGPEVIPATRHAPVR